CLTLSARTCGERRSDMDDDRTQKGRAAPGDRKLPEGVYYRGRALWIRYSVNGEELREPVDEALDEKGVPRTPREASRLRGERLAEHAGCLAGRARHAFLVERLVNRLAQLLTE